MNLLEKIKKIINFGIVTNVTRDVNFFPDTQIQSLDKIKNVIVIYPYGYSANAPVNKHAIVIQVGNAENLVALPLNDKTRPKDLKAGEVVNGNFEVGSIIKFKENGDIDVTAKNDITLNITGKAIINTGGDTIINSGGNTTINSSSHTINSPTTINDNLQVNGTITSIGNITSGAIVSGVTVTAGGAIMSAAGMSSPGPVNASGEVTGNGKALSTHTHFVAAAPGESNAPT